MDKRFAILGILVTVALVGAGCSSNDAGPFGIANSDPDAPIGVVGTYEDVIKHKGDMMLVRPSDIVRSGQGKDGMPVITDPKFVSVDEALAEEYLFDETYGVSVLDDGEYKFYPHQILSWHEIVLDEINGKSAAVTHSELTGVSRVFEGIAEDGSDRTFGVSGLVWNNNSLLYDAETESLWSQVLGVGVYGEGAGEVMSELPFDLVSWGVWKLNHPEGVVLSSDTGSVRAYDRSPYGPYTVAEVIYFPFVNEPIRALRPKDVVLGVVSEDGQKGYQEGPIVESSAGVKNDTIGEINVVVWFDDQERVLRAHERGDLEFETVVEGKLIDVDGNEWVLGDTDRELTFGDTTLDQLQIQTMFWYLWSSLYPESELYANVSGKGLVDGPFVLQLGEGQKEDDGIILKVTDPNFGKPSVEVK